MLVLAALGAAAAGYPQVNSVVAVGVAIFIAIAGFRLAQRTLATLLDTAPKGLAEQVRSRAEGVAGVVSVKRVRVRPAGGRAIGEVLVDVSRTLPLERVAAIKQRIAAAVAEDLPDAELTITADPVQLDDESIMERVMLTAARLRLPVHHITVQNLEGQLAVSFDVEVDGAMTLARAHEVADRLEAAIQEELGPRSRSRAISSRSRSAISKAREADAATVARIASTLAASTAEGAIRRCTASGFERRRQASS